MTLSPLLVALLGLVTAVVGGAGLWSFLVARRTSSGGIHTSTADALWDAQNKYQERTDAELSKLRLHAERLDVDYREERRARLECEARLGKLEADSQYLKIIDAAKVAAAKIIAEAQAQSVAVTDAARVASVAVTDAADVARQKLEDEKEHE